MKKLVTLTRTGFASIFDFHKNIPYAYNIHMLCCCKQKYFKSYIHGKKTDEDFIYQTQKYQAILKKRFAIQSRKTYKKIQPRFTKHWRAQVWISGGGLKFSEFTPKRANLDLKSFLMDLELFGNKYEHRAHRWRMFFKFLVTMTTYVYR